MGQSHRAGCQSGGRDRDSGIRDMDSGIRDMDLGLRDRDSGSRDMDLGSRDMDLGVTIGSSPALLPGWLFPAQGDLSIPMENPQESAHGRKGECCRPSPAEPGMCLFWGFFGRGWLCPSEPCPKIRAGSSRREPPQGQREFSRAEMPERSRQRRFCRPLFALSPSSRAH